MLLVRYQVHLGLAQYDPEQELTTLATPDVARRVLETGIQNVVITDGEPLQLQRELAPLVTELKSAGRRIEIETNGTFAPFGTLAEEVDQ